MNSVRPAVTAPIHACVCRRYDIDLRDDRELAYQRLKKFCMAGFVSVTDFRCAVTCSSTDQAAL